MKEVEANEKIRELEFKVKNLIESMEGKNRIIYELERTNLSIQQVIKRGKDFDEALTIDMIEDHPNGKVIFVY